MSKQNAFWKLSRKTALSAAAAVVAMSAIFATPTTALAGSYPSKPVTLVIPYRAGGSTETMARIFSRALGKELGQKVIVVTRPGAGGAVGSTFVSAAPADGYTLLFVALWSLTWTPLTQKDVQFGLDSFRYIAGITEYQQALVATPDQPYKTFAELISYSKDNPGLNVADQGGMSKAFVNFIAKKAGVDWTAIPTKGGGEMIPFLLGKKVDFAWSGGVHTKYGDKIIVLASFNADRLASAPDAPAIKELYGVSMPAAAIIVAPAGVPDDVARTVEAAIKKAMDDPAFGDILAKLKFPKKFVGSDKLKANAADAVVNLKKVIAAMQ